MAHWSTRMSKTSPKSSSFHASEPNRFSQWLNPPRMFWRFHASETAPRYRRCFCLRLMISSFSSWLLDMLKRLHGPQSPQGQLYHMWRGRVQAIRHNRNCLSLNRLRFWPWFKPILITFCCDWTSIWLASGATSVKTSIMGTGCCNLLACGPSYARKSRSTASGSLRTRERSICELASIPSGGIFPFCGWDQSSSSCKTSKPGTWQSCGSDDWMASCSQQQMHGCSSVVLGTALSGRDSRCANKAKLPCWTPRRMAPFGRKTLACLCIHLPYSVLPWNTACQLLRFIGILSGLGR